MTGKGEKGKELKRRRRTGDGEKEVEVEGGEKKIRVCMKGEGQVDRARVEGKGQVEQARAECSGRTRRRGCAPSASFATWKAGGPFPEHKMNRKLGDASELWRQTTDLLKIMSLLQWNNEAVGPSVRAGVSACPLLFRWYTYTH